MDAKSRDRSLPAPPTAARRREISVHHGIERVDDYAWLRTPDWQEAMRDPSKLDAEIRTYLEAENAYTEAALKHTEGLQAKLFEEMKGRIKEDDSSVPAPDGPFDYYTRFVTGGQHPLFCRRPRAAAEAGEDVLIDGDALARPHAYFRIGAVAHSPDHALVAYAADTQGAEYFDIRFRDIASGDELGEPIPDTSANMVWAGDGRSLFYVRLDENHRPRQVYRHVLGTSADDDALVYEEPDAGFYVGLGKTQDRRFVVVATRDHQTGEVRLIDAAEPDKAPILVAPRIAGQEYSVEHHGDRLIVLTNGPDAEDFKIVETPLAAPGRENWRDIERHRPGRLILDIVVFKDWLVRLEREDGLPRIVVRRLSDGAEHAIAFAEEAYALGMSAGFEFDTDTLRFSYSSMRMPAQVFDYDMATRERSLRKTQDVPSGHDPDAYVTRRVMAPAADGETVPVSLLYRTDTPLDGSAPLLLYGYGSYGITIPAGFNTNCLSLVDRGFVYAIAHIRGGKDKGYRWYTSGKLAGKTNTFSDFIAAANHLIAERFTARGAIVAHGGSAGGMLMGAAANMAPDLFRGIVAEVPFVDVLATMLDASLPLTPPEWLEWGNPIENQEEYERIAAYSPYDNVRAQAYPHILALTGLSDPRVTYWEPAKWVAKLRALKTDDNLLLLRTNMEAGHAGAAGRFDRLKEVALAYAFALTIAGRDT